MADYFEQYPTQGDLAREQIRRRGLLYFGDVQDEVRRRLQQLPDDARRAFAVSCAARLMAQHEQLPASEQRPFTIGWRPILDAIWSGLAGQRDYARQRVSEALRAFHQSPFDHADGPDGPNDADDDTAAASIYAAECYLSGDTQPACLAAERAIDAAFNIAQKELQLDSNEFRWDPTAEPTPLAKESMHPAVQAELRKQLAALAELEQGGVTSANLERMRDCDL